jgi:nitrogen fixation protein NifU and related proteins
MASASLMTAKLKNKSRAESEELLNAFTSMLTAEDEADPPKQLGDLRLLKGVRKFPMRVKCATLAWHALEQALAHPGQKEAEFSDE